ncbi:MAG TPA: EAL domain-containing protein [Rhodocyclaceae bacterium]|nr:EAL domain-containing protein [Rhodocyclaceae bacterium]
MSSSQSPHAVAEADGQSRVVPPPSRRMPEPPRAIPAPCPTVGSPGLGGIPLGRQAELLRWALEASGEGVIITDSSLAIIFANPAVTDITGYTNGEIIGQTPRLFASGRHDREFYRNIRKQLSEHGAWQGEIWDRRKNGEVYPKWLAIRTIRDPVGDVGYYIGTFSDISERKATELRMHFLAYYDPLTGLPNRLLLRDRFQQASAAALRNGSTVALLSLDLDRFKDINDSLGHPLGDKLLQAVARRLQRCLQDTDTVSRSGGDEFTIILADGRGAEDAALVLDKLRQRLGEEFQVEGHGLHVTFGMGIGFFPEDGADFDALMQKTDLAMYRAKEAGPNSYRYFTDDMNAAAVEKITLENGLRKALERQELILHYQPQVDIASGRIIGLEALIRWQHGQLGFMGPGRFIPVAEETGLIVPIGEWVIREACRQVQAWRRAGRGEVSVAVNLSALQFARSNLIEVVASALAESGLPPACLELELTESILIQDQDNVLATVDRLKELGVQLSIDDFGTGYSSLSYLKRFKVDRLKIDQSFTRGLPASEDDAAIVRTIIQMCASLKLGVIAEGVETPEQARFLQEAGCSMAQGYFFGKPAADPWAALPVALP